jgi:hypothetical protein
MNIDINISRVLAHSVMLFAKDDWSKDYPSIPWEEPQMCGPSYKPADLSAANREAVQASLETYPIQRAIDVAARLGQKVEVPVYKDGVQTGTKTYDFAGKSDIDITKNVSEALNQLAGSQAKTQLDIAQKYGVPFAEQRVSELKAADPERYKLYDQFLKDIGQRSIAETAPAAPSYERVGMPTTPQDTGEAANIRSNLERQISAGLAQAGTLDPAMIRAAEQAVRARGTATGNVLGNLSAFREARAVGEAVANADVQRRQQAIGLLQSGQTTSDVANRQAQEAFQNILAATGQRNTAQQQTFAGQMANQQQRQGAQQQNIANIQSALGLQPIVSQAAQLGGLQQGASPFAAPQLMQGMQQASPSQLIQTGANFSLSNAQNQFNAAQAGSPLAVFQGLAGGIANLGSGYRSYMGP